MNESIYQRENWLDACKGLAIILVVLGHLLSGNMEKGVLARNWLQDVLEGIKLFHMALFIMLSGVAFSLSKNKTLRGGVEKA